LLPRCINSIYKQIILPYEVIISISSVKDVESTKKEVESLLEKFRKRLNIIILYTRENKYSGENRNAAVSAASGDIITFIDADDLMYHNRLYVISRIFSADSSCIGILHYFTENEETRDERWNFSPDNVTPYLYTDKLHFGHPSFRRRIFDEFKYQNTARMQDIKFVDSILPKYISNLRIYNKKLSHYVSNDSAYYSKFKK